VKSEILLFITPIIAMRALIITVMIRSKKQRERERDSSASVFIFLLPFLSLFIIPNLVFVLCYYYYNYNSSLLLPLFFLRRRWVVKQIDSIVKSEVLYNRDH
jgi:hypothetical protein